MPLKLTHPVSLSGPGKCLNAMWCTRLILSWKMGRDLVDFADNPLHLVSYSLPTDCWLSWNELTPHLLHRSQAALGRAVDVQVLRTQLGVLPEPGVIRSAAPPPALSRRDPLGICHRPGAGVFTSATGGCPSQDGAAPDAGELLICAHICHPLRPMTTRQGWLPRSKSLVAWWKSRCRAGR